MAGNRKGDSHEGPRAIPENRWEESAEAERQQDVLAEEVLSERDALPETDETGSDLTGALERGTRRAHERADEQARMRPRSVKDPEQPT